MEDLRHLRVNRWVPAPHGRRLWEDELAAQLAKFVEAVDSKSSDQLTTVHVICTYVSRSSIKSFAKIQA